MFWISRINWRIAALCSVLVVVIGNGVSVFITDATTLTFVRFLVGLLGQGTAFVIGISMIQSTTDPDKNFGFVIAAQVAFGVLALLSLQRIVIGFDSVGGVYIPLAALAIIGLPLIRKLATGFEAQPDQADQKQAGSVFLPVAGLLVMLIWCIGLGSMWAFVSLIGEAGGLEAVDAQLALAVSSGVAILGAIGAAALAGKGVGRFMPVTIALLVQAGMAWFLQGEMNWLEMAIKASIFQIFWNMTGPFIMGAIASSDTSGKVSVLIPAAQTAGFSIGPVIALEFMTDGSLLAANVTTIVCCLIALVLFIPLSARLKAAGY
jgi:hypothetical protein